MTFGVSLVVLLVGEIVVEGFGFFSKLEVFVISEKNLGFGVKLIGVGILVLLIIRWVIFVKLSILSVFFYL